MATKQQQVYRCEVCGNVVGVLHEAAGTLVCCGQQMTQLEENTTDAATEKHVPIIETVGSKIVVKVGSVEHPMSEEHYIEFIELIADSKQYIKYLTPGEAPQAEFQIDADKISARAYCNLHGLWKQ